MEALLMVSRQWRVAVLPAPPSTSGSPSSQDAPVAPVPAAANPVVQPPLDVAPSDAVDEALPTAATSEAWSFVSLAAIWIAGALLVLVRLLFGTARLWW